MERTNSTFIVFAVVVAAVAFFFLRIVSDDSLPGSTSRGVWNNTAEDAAREGGWFASQDGSVPSAASTSRSGAPTARSGAPLYGPGRTSTGSSGRAGVVVGGGTGGRSFVGSGSGAERLAGRGSVRVAGGTTAPGTGKLEPSGGARSNLVETLASREPSRGLLDPVDPFAGNEEGVLLSLPMDKTIEAEDGTQPAMEQDLDIGAEGVKFTEDSVLAFPNAGNIKGESGTISFDIEPDFNGSDPTDHFLVQMRTPNEWGNRMEILKNGRYLRFVFFDENGVESGISVPIESWTPGDRHNVSVAWDEERAQASLYIDGQLGGQTQLQGKLRPDPQAMLYVGSDLPQNRRGFRGTMYNFRVEDASRY